MNSRKVDEQNAFNDRLKRAVPRDCLFNDPLDHIVLQKEQPSILALQIPSPMRPYRFISPAVSKFFHLRQSLLNDGLEVRDTLLQDHPCVASPGSNDARYSVNENMTAGIKNTQRTP